MQKELVDEAYVKGGDGGSAIIHPFCVFLGGPRPGKEEKLITSKIDLEQLGAVKV
jgi:nitrilase